MNQNVDVASENLEKIGWLKGLDEEEITKVAGACSSEEAPAGSIIVKKGEKGDKFYIIKSGTVKCYVSENDTNPLYLGKGKFFGELALLKDQPRAATVEAVKDVQLLTLNRQAFQVLLDQSTSSFGFLTRLVLQRAPWRNAIPKTLIAKTS